MFPGFYHQNCFLSQGMFSTIYFIGLMRVRVLLKRDMGVLEEGEAQVKQGQLQEKPRYSRANYMRSPGIAGFIPRRSPGIAGFIQRRIQGKAWFIFWQHSQVQQGLYSKRPRYSRSYMHKEKPKYSKVYSEKPRYSRVYVETPR